LTFSKEIMRYYFLSLLCIASACLAQAESKIHGSWKSDIELTSAYLLAHSNLDDYKKKSLQIRFGRTTITFDPSGTGTVITEAFNIPTSDGRPLNMAEQSTTFSYEILGETADQLVIGFKGVDPDSKVDSFALFKFEDKDIYSVEIGENLFDLNGREFFRRSESKKKENKPEQATPRKPSD